MNFLLWSDQDLAIPIYNLGFGISYELFLTYLDSVVWNFSYLPFVVILLLDYLCTFSNISPPTLFFSPFPPKCKLGPGLLFIHV